MKRAAFATIGVLLSAPLVAAEPEFESAPVLQASEILPPELLQGEHHRVREDVRTDGYLNYYVIDSDFGEFVAEGTPLLRIRVREIAALAELEEFSESKLFIEAVKGAGIDLGKGLWKGGADPVRSVKAAPEGLDRLFSKIARSASLGIKVGAEKTGDLIGLGGADTEESEPDLEKITASYYDVTASEREWAARLGVNPYSSNETLRRAIRRMSRIDFAGEATFAVASGLLIPVPGLGTVASTINEAADEIWATDPYELREANIGKLQESAVADSVIDAFIGHPWYTPTMQTVLIHLLQSMDGASGTMTVLDVAIEAESEAEARYFANNIVLMAWFHENEVPIKSVLAEFHLPQAVTTDGRQIGFAPLDYLFWGEEFVGVAQAAVARSALGNQEIWVLGTVSDRARMEIEKLDVGVRDEVGDLVLRTATETK